MTRVLAVAAAVGALFLAVLVFSAALDRPSASASATASVDAPRDRVWGIVTAFDEYADWNPYMRRVDGDAQDGGAVVVRLETSNGSSELSASITVYRPPRKLGWTSRLVAPGLRDVEYEIIVTELARDRTRVVQHARYEGLLAPFVDRTALEDGLESMTRALAARAEAGA